MKTKIQLLAMAASGIFFCTSNMYGQHHSSDVYWHTDPDLKTCSMVIDPSLTQDQWNRYTRQVGVIASMKSMASAETLGKNHFSIAFEYQMTPVDQHDAAWINTFSHPDGECPLGDRIKLPMLRAKFGISGKMDVGVLWTTAPGANYGIIGGELKYAILEETSKRPAGAIRLSYSALTGVPDYNIGMGNIDLLISKKIAGISLYGGIKESLVIGTETTSKVNLDTKSLLATNGIVGVSYSFWLINTTVEYEISNVNTLSFMIALQTFKRK